MRPALDVSWCSTIRIGRGMGQSWRASVESQYPLDADFQDAWRRTAMQPRIAYATSHARRTTTAPHRPLGRVRPNSGLPEFGHFINWPTSEACDFGWRDREGACSMQKAFQFTPSPPLGRQGHPA